MLKSNFDEIFNVKDKEHTILRDTRILMIKQSLPILMKLLWQISKIKITKTKNLKKSILQNGSNCQTNFYLM